MAADGTKVQRKPKCKVNTKPVVDDAGQKKVVQVIDKCGQRCGAGDEHYGSKFSVKPSPIPTSSTKKRGREFSVDGRRAKIRRMDHTVKLHCASILREFMRHPDGWIFSEPVDQVKIPDYFSIIRKPMDLGTIKQKLEENLYFNAEEFADDVRLTFSNAMVYNPPGDKVHNTAKEFNWCFTNKCIWRKLDVKVKDERANLKGQDSKQTVEKSYHDIKQIGLNRAPMRTKCDNNMPMSLKEDHKIQTLSLWGKKRISSDGPGHVLIEERCARLSTPATTSFSSEGWSSFADQMSPKRASRVAMLKCRFASTIYKATHQDGNYDPVKMKQERDRLEKEQLEEKARNEKKIKVVEASMRMEKAELKMQREREREAARMALQKIKKSVDFGDNLEAMKELELMCRPTSMRGSCGCHVSPLAQFGLFLKADDYWEEEDEIEEGEIV